MKEAGYEKGFDVKVMAVNNKSYGTGIVQAYLPMLKKIGINVIIEQVEGAVMTEKVYTSNDYQAYMSSFTSGPMIIWFYIAGILRIRMHPAIISNSTIRNTMRCWIRRR